MKREDKILFGYCPKNIRKEIIHSYKVSRVAVAEQEKKPQQQSSSKNATTKKKL